MERIKRKSHNVVCEVVRGTSQELAVDTRADETLCCGTRGSMKTISQLLAFLKYVGRGYGHFWRGIIFDQEYRFLDDIILKSKHIFSQLGAEYNISEKRWTFPTGESLIFRIMKTDDDYWRFHGHEYTFVGFNELSKYPTSYLYDTIQSCNRSGFVPELNPVYDSKTKKMLILPPIPLMVFSTTNPYGAGHFWVKKRFIDVAPYGHIVYRDTEVYNPATDEMITMRRSQVAIFSSYIENPFLSPKYIAGLVNHPDPNIRAAWAMGSWDITAGGMFGDLWRRERHVIPRFAIPKNWFINRTFDWGSSHPFSVGWWAQANGEEVDVLLDNGTWSKFAPPAGSLIQIYEYYGTNEIGTNKGLQLGARQIAKDIVAIEHALYDSGWLDSEIHAGAADNQIWNKINDDTPSIADLMASERVTWINSNKSAGSRINGAQIMRDMLEDTLKNNVERPHIYFMSNCVSSIATLPILPRDTKKLDDVDTNAEDHCWDMTRYRLLQGIEDGSITARVRY